MLMDFCMYTEFGIRLAYASSLYFQMNGKREKESSKKE